jgi:hypothetical protein
MRSWRLLRLVKRSLQLTQAERRMLGRAYLELARIDVLLRLRGFSGSVEGAPPARALPTGGLTADDLSRGRSYARWLDVAARHHLVSAHCLHRSLALHYWLRREGLPSSLQIGVRKQGGELRAHAWVELEGHVVNDAPTFTAAFKPLTGTGGQLPTWNGEVVGELAAHAAWQA